MPRLLILNNTILMLCCSIYLGTGVSLVFLQLPVEPQLTPANYHVVFVDQVARATVLFTWITIVMMITGAIMLVTEWFSGLRWIPIVVLVALTAATLITTRMIFPFNNRLAAGITDPAELARIFSTWAMLSRVRFVFWVIEWAAMMAWFYALAVKARADR